jgi:hypothetical protein
MRQEIPENCITILQQFCEKARAAGRALQEKDIPDSDLNALINAGLNVDALLCEMGLPAGIRNTITKKKKKSKDSAAKWKKANQRWLYSEKYRDLSNHSHEENQQRKAERKERNKLKRSGKLETIIKT